MVQKALVVDDSPAELANIKSILSDAGCLVVVASSGKEAVEKAKAEKPTVIFLDIVMPDMEGLELIRELRRADPAVKIIAMSGGGRGPASYLELALKFGARQVLPKPFTKDSLIAVVKDVLAM